ncbi:MAG: TolC family protein [Pseudomonadota bacterium]
MRIDALLPPTARAARTLALTAVAALLAGCATFSPDGGFGPVERSAQQRLGKDLQWARTPEQRAALDARVAELLAQPLSADAAVQLALLNHRGLQAGFYELGVGEAELVQAGRLPNPGFSFGRFSRGDEREIERSLHLNLARLLALPLAAPMERARFERVQRRVTEQVLGVAADARKAWIAAVAADEALRYRLQVQTAAEAGAELARRMGAAGNWNVLNQAREQGFLADATLGVARAQRAQLAARERLTRLLGLWGAQTAFRLPERLPDLPAAALDAPDIEREAMASRLDVQAAKLESEAMARQLGLNRVTRFVNVLDLGLEHNSSNEAPTQRGYEIGIELPLFDWGGARVAKAEALYMQSVHRAAQTAIDARSEVREAYLGYRGAHDIARHYRDEVVPLAKQVSDQNLLRYNGMLIGVFDLLADARAQIGAVGASIDALRDFWLADADLQQALIGRPAMAAPTGPAPSAPAAADAAAH